MLVVRLLKPGFHPPRAKKGLRSLLLHPAVKLVKLEYLLQLQALDVLFFQWRLVFLDLPGNRS